MTEAEEKHNMQVAIAGSVIIHSALLFVLAWLMGLDQTARALWAAMHSPKQLVVKEEPRVSMIFPEQITLPPAVKPKLSDMQKFMRTDGLNDTGAKPARTDFISDRNTTASAAQAPFPGATENMPTLTGGPKPTEHLRQQPKLAMALPETESNPLTAPASKPVARMIEDLDKGGPGVKPTLDLQVKRAVDPIASPPKAEPASGFPTTMGEVKGTITNKGVDSVNAEATPVGRFMRQVTSSVEKQWHALFRQRGSGQISSGYLKVSFFVNKEGQPEDLKFIEKTGDAAVEDLTLEAILKANIPPIPKELLPALDGERLRVDYDILIQ
jgi:outer membrane biosynthesis protein TonB